MTQETLSPETQDSSADVADVVAASAQASEPRTKQTILIVDDVSINRAILADMLGDDYDIIEVENGKQAVATMAKMQSEISLVLLDIVMPEMDGFEVLATMNNRGWIEKIPVIMVSAETASSSIERAYLLGVTDFINRPFDASIVRHRVNNTLMLYAEQKALINMVVDQIQEREKSVNLMVSILSQVVEFRNGESGLHVLHVNTLTNMLLDQLVKMGYVDYTPQEIKDITMASSLHDIGKIAIPEEVLNKPGRLTDAEFDLMKQHSAIGAEMLHNLPSFQDEPLLQTSYEICRWHHERWDGRGYPDGLKGDEIPVSAQVVALADVYDALTSERVYKPAFDHDKAMAMILNGECGAFNPDLLACFEEIADHVHQELKLDSLSTHALRETGKATEDMMRPEVLGPSARTLDLLEHERTKYNFYAMMSNEVQFEVTLDPPMMIISDWSDRKLGLPEIIMNPLEDPELIAMFGEEQLTLISEGLRSTLPASPIVEFDLRANVDGEARWYQMWARAMWEGGESDNPHYAGFIGKLIDVHESVLRMTELENRATHDSLTGLTNHDFARTVFSERMQANPDDAYMMMVLDVDKFKDVNDSHGHLHGDEVLKGLAKALRHAVRDHDEVARVGGDEFLIAMQLESIVDPGPLTERVYKSISNDMAALGVTVSMGVACVRGGDVPYDKLFGLADKFLYDMKRNGRNGFVLHELEAEELREGTGVAFMDDEEGGSVVSKIDETPEA